jgi:hypothetical protein
MIWLIGFLLLLYGAWFLLTRTPRSPLHPKATQPEPPPPPPDAFQVKLAQAISTYEKDQLAFAIRRMVILEGHPDALLVSLEAKYGRCEGVPFLDLSGGWDLRTREVIRAWMARNEMPFSENAPAVQQLEQALEARVTQQAQEILRRTLGGSG